MKNHKLSLALLLIAAGSVSFIHGDSQRPEPTDAVLERVAQRLDGSANEFALLAAVFPNTEPFAQFHIYAQGRADAYADAAARVRAEVGSLTSSSLGAVDRHALRLPAGCRSINDQ